MSEYYYDERMAVYSNDDKDPVTGETLHIYKLYNESGEVVTLFNVVEKNPSRYAVILAAKNGEKNSVVRNRKNNPVKLKLNGDV